MLALFWCVAYIVMLPDSHYVGTRRWHGISLYHLNWAAGILWAGSMNILLISNRLSEPRRWAVQAASLLPYPMTCIGQVILFTYEDPEVTRRWFVHIQLGPLQLLPALLCLAFLMMGFRIALTAKAVTGRFQGVVIFAHASCTVITFGHSYSLTRDSTALQLMSLALFCQVVGMGIAWQLELIMRNLWNSGIRSLQENELLQSELREKHKAENVAFAQLRDENSRLRKRASQAATLVDLQARRRLNAESQLRKVTNRSRYDGPS